MSEDLCPHCSQKMPPVATELSIFYMCDNHAFTRMTGTTEEELRNQAIEILEVYPYGMLCSATLLDKHGNEVRRHGISVHAKAKYDTEYWECEVEKWVDSIKSDPEVLNLLNAGKVRQYQKA